MTTEKKFKKIIQLSELVNNQIDLLYDNGFIICDSQLVNYMYLLENIYFKSNFDENTCKIIDWWLYEDKSVTALQSENGKDISLQNVDELWNYCKDHMI